MSSNWPGRSPVIHAEYRSSVPSFASLDGQDVPLQASSAGELKTTSTNTPPVTPGTTVTETSVTVGTSSTAIVAANAARKALWLFNNGTVDVFIDQGTATVAGGFPLKAGTGIAWTSQDPDVGLAVNGIVASGSADVRVRWVV